MPSHHLTDEAMLQVLRTGQHNCQIVNTDPRIVIQCEEQDKQKTPQVIES